MTCTFCRDELESKGISVHRTGRKKLHSLFQLRTKRVRMRCDRKCLRVEVVITTMLTHSTIIVTLNKTCITENSALMCNYVMWHPHLFALKSFLYRRSVSKLVFLNIWSINIYCKTKKKIYIYILAAKFTDVFCQITANQLKNVMQ